MRLGERDHCCGGKSGQNHVHPGQPHSLVPTLADGGAAQLAGLRHGPLGDKSVPPLGQPAGVGPTLKRTEANPRRAGQLAELRHGPPWI